MWPLLLVSLLRFGYICFLILWSTYSGSNVDIGVQLDPWCDHYVTIWTWSLPWQNTDRSGSTFMKNEENVKSIVHKTRVHTKSRSVSSNLGIKEKSVSVLFGWRLVILFIYYSKMGLLKILSFIGVVIV